MNNLSFKNNRWIKFNINGVSCFGITRQFADIDSRENIVYHNYIDYMSEAYTREANKSQRMLWAEFTHEMNPVFISFEKPKQKSNTTVEQYEKHKN